MFDLLWRDVLTLRQLEDVLRSIDDLDGAIWIHQANITSLEPPLGIEALRSLVWALVVALEDGGAIHADLATGVGLISREILHLRKIFKTQLD